MKNGISQNLALGLIYRIPQDLKMVIGKLLNLPSLENMHFVDKSWKHLVQQICHHWIERYFPYLKAKQIFHATPLKILTEEFLTYENLLSQYTSTLNRNFTMSHVLAALEGSKEAVVATTRNLVKRQACFLYALYVMSGHSLPTLLARGIKKSEIISLAIHMAAEVDYLAAVKRLLTEDELSHFDKGLAFVYAAENGHLSIVKLFLAADAISKIDLETGFCNAAIHNQLEVVKYLLATVDFPTHILEMMHKDAIHSEKHEIAHEIKNRLQPNILGGSKTFTPMHAKNSSSKNEEDMKAISQKSKKKYSFCRQM